jgi:hypothetical protein
LRRQEGLIFAVRSVAIQRTETIEPAKSTKKKADPSKIIELFIPV